MTTQAVHWHEGMFMRPQHFQASLRYLLDQMRRSHLWDVHYGWGLRSIDIDSDALSNCLGQRSERFGRTVIFSNYIIGLDCGYPRAGGRCTGAPVQRPLPFSPVSTCSFPVSCSWKSQDHSILCAESNPSLTRSFCRGYTASVRVRTPRASRASRPCHDGQAGPVGCASDARRSSEHAAMSVVTTLHRCSTDTATRFARGGEIEKRSRRVETRSRRRFGRGGKAPAFGRGSFPTTPAGDADVS